MIFRWFDRSALTDPIGCKGVDVGLKTDPNLSVFPHPFSLRFILLILLSILLSLFLIGADCSNSSNGDSDDGETEGGDDDSEDDDDAVDDCGYKIMTVPEGCDECHGAPPQTSRHPQNHRCSRCHGSVVDDAYTILHTGRHRDGKVDYAVGCTSCHGWNQGTSPPQNLSGECGVDKKGVGAHAAMRREAIRAHKVACNNCHTVPTGTWEAGHIDGDNQAEVKFKLLAKADGASPTWNGTTCSGVYCHGATLTGGTHKEPSWTDESGKAKMCGACHRLTDPEGNADSDCSSCHPTSVKSDRTIIEDGTHINGTIDMASDAKKQ
jgi:predicted CxxxxCH...CXXCH cytochrome family protein